MNFPKPDFHKPISLHIQIAEIIEKIIVDKEIPVGENLPPENTLCDSFGVNVHTLRKALALLVKKGYLFRRPKHGTVVVSAKPDTSIDISKRNGICLVICTGSVFKPFGSQIFNEMINGIEGCAREKSLNLLYRTLDESDKKLYLSGKENELAGLIVTGNNTPKHFKIIKKIGIPFVLIGDLYQKERVTEPVDIIATDDFGSSHLATKHLIGLGHKQIACFARDFSYPWGEDILDGYRQALKEAGLPYNKELVVQTGVPGVNPGYSAMQKFLEKGGNPGACAPDFTGLVCMDSSKIYFGIMKAFGEKNIRVPEDVSVVLDEHISDFTATTVDYREVGKATLDRLVEKLTGGADWKPQRLVIPGKLVPGSSSVKYIKGK